jgi:hypothetical protein
MNKDNSPQLLQYVQELTPEMERYLQCMESLKSRIENIDTKIKSKGFKTSQYNIESICLQFRLCTELILLAAFSSNEKKYELLLIELVNIWNPKDFIKIAEKVNPNFYPEKLTFKKQPVKDNLQADGIAVFPKNSLPKNELLYINKKCSEFLHPQNLWARDKDYKGVYSQFNNWIIKIKDLAQSHHVKLYNNKVSIFCQMEFVKNGKIKIGVMVENPK